MAVSPRLAASSSVAEAVRAWELVIGADRVIRDTARYNTDTSSFRGRIPVALRPSCTEQVQAIARIAQKFAVPIYPVSTGHNWGYGSSVPIRSPGVIVDLSGMNRVIEVDEELGVATLEPGVTQQQLSAYLQSHGLPFLVPVTGAGPTCSVLANALERGFGVTPVTDHFGAILSMKVVLPDGEIHESYTRAFNASGAARAYKWGTGPYLDGLFSQSNLGIVVDASIALQRRAERIGALFFVLHSNREAEQISGPLRQMLGAAGQNIGAINVMSRSRVECMLAGAGKVMGSGTGKQDVPDGAWFGFGSVYGSRELYEATCRLIGRSLQGHARRIRIYTRSDIRRMRWLSLLASAAGWRGAAGVVDRLEAAIGIVEGAPTTFALPLAYAKSGWAKESRRLNPAQDGCGLFWYSPIVPLRSGTVEQFIEFAERTCGKYGLPAPITLTTLSHRCYASTIPLLFDPKHGESERAATACLENLLEEGLKLGFVPYRMGSQFMHALAGTCNGVAGRAIKAALDANQVLAPGRYID
jgi:4-cresol dehydrogenase (hydroxylating)